MKHQNHQIVIIMAENKPGVLSKISSLCRRRRYNIKSLNAGTTHLNDISQITIIFSKEENRINNIINQIDKIIEVHSIEVVEAKNVIDKELVLLALKNDSEAIDMLKNKFHDAQVDVISKTEIYSLVQIVGEENEIEHIMQNIEKKQIIKMIRSGTIALRI